MAFKKLLEQIIFILILYTLEERELHQLLKKLLHLIVLQQPEQETLSIIFLQITEQMQQD